MHSPAPCLSRIVIPARKQAAGSLPVSIRSIRPATGHLIRFWHFFSGRRNHNHPSWHLLKHLQPWGSGPPKTPSPEPPSAKRRRLAPENRLRFAEAPAETPNPESFFNDNPDSVCRRARSSKPTPRSRQNRAPICRNSGVGGCGLSEPRREGWPARARPVTTRTKGTFFSPPPQQGAQLVRSRAPKRTKSAPCREKPLGTVRFVCAAGEEARGGGIGDGVRRLSKSWRRYGAVRRICRLGAMVAPAASQLEPPKPQRAGTRRSAGRARSIARSTEAGRSGAGRRICTGPTTGWVNSAHVQRFRR